MKSKKLLPEKDRSISFPKVDSPPLTGAVRIDQDTSVRIKTVVVYDVPECKGNVKITIRDWDNWHDCTSRNWTEYHWIVKSITHELV